MQRCAVAKVVDLHLDASTVCSVTDRCIEVRLGSVSHPVMMLAATNAVVFCTGQQPGLCNITGYELDSHHQRGGGYQRAAVLHEL